MLGLSTASVIVYGAVALGILAVALWLYRRGADRERARQARETLDSKERQDEAASRSPRDRDSLVDKLRRHDF